MSKREGPTTLAALDLGSNSFHMIVAQVIDGRLHVIDRLREMVQLRAGLGDDGLLAEEVQQRALDCLRRFGQRLRGIPEQHVRAVGTNTLRKARDASQFLERARETLGHTIEVIAGDEEARLIYLGVAHELGFDESRRLVFDIGGGSTEFIIGEGFEGIQRESIGMGCVSWTMQFFQDGDISTKKLRKAVIAARSELLDIDVRYREYGWNEVVGSSGTVRAISDAASRRGWCPDGTITAEAMTKIYQHLLEVGHADKIELPGIDVARRRVFAGGFAILQGIFDSLAFKKIIISDGAMREGLLYDFLGRFRQHGDIRDHTVQSFSQRYHIDGLHARRVRATCLDIHNKVAQFWGIEGTANELLLCWASYLHESGLAISHSKYHLHGAYLIANSDMPGFSRQEQALLASLIRGQRRNVYTSDFDALAADQREKALYLCIILRLALLLNRSRQPEQPIDLQLVPQPMGLMIRSPLGWLDAHPLISADLEQEADYLAVVGFRLAVN